MSQKRRFNKYLIINNKIAQLLRSVTHCYAKCYVTSLSVTSCNALLRGVTCYALCRYALNEASNDT